MGRDCASERVPIGLGGQPDQALALLVEFGLEAHAAERSVAQIAS